MINNTLASSQVGTVEADAPAFVRGDAVNFTVKLDPTKTDFLPAIGPYSVKEIVLVRHIDITTQQEVACVPAFSGQTEFAIPFLAEDSGRSDEFFAFVVTTLAPLDLLALEVGQAKPSANAVTTRSISLRTAAVSGSGLEGQELGDDGLAGGFIRTAETSGTLLGVPQSSRASSTEDSMGAAGGAVGLKLECSTDVVGGDAFSVVRFTIVRETTVDIAGTLTGEGRSVFGGIFLEDRTTNTGLIRRELSDEVRNLTVSESLRLAPADDTLRLTMSHGCGIVIGQPISGSVEGRINLRLTP